MSQPSPAPPSPYKWSPGTPTSPVDLPRRLSSLGFSQFRHSPSVMEITPSKDGNQPVSASPRSNIGRKRTPRSLIRSTPGSGHRAQIHRIFQDAHASLQRDVTFASSPIGSIDSRLPGSAETTHSREDHVLPDASNIKQWRFSRAPHQLARVEVDVREPLPEQLPVEPLSSGFTTPTGLPRLPPRPDLSSPVSVKSQPDVEQKIPLPHCPGVLTHLERPFFALHVHQNKDSRDSQAHLDVDSPPAITSAPIPDSDKSSTDSDAEIFLSTPARKAADSARAKRGLSRLAIRSSSDKENIDPDTPCPDPAVHLSTPSPYHPQRSLSPPYYRVDCRGSPLPPLRTRPPPASRYISLPRAKHPGQPILARPAPHYRPKSPLPTLQARRHWSQYASPPEPLPSPTEAGYTFSTGAAKVVGLSPAPDSRIRDSYCTDTLVSLVQAKPRFRKTGIGAMTRGASRFYHNGRQSSATSHPAHQRPLVNRRPASARDHRSSVHFMSSPPRPAQHELTAETPFERRKRARRDSAADAGVRVARDSIVEERDADVSMMDVEEVDSESDAIRELSPNVMPYRKGREPKATKRNRTASYWDRDILEMQHRVKEGAESEKEDGDKEKNIGRISQGGLSDKATGSSENEDEQEKENVEAEVGEGDGGLGDEMEVDERVDVVAG